MPERPNLPPFKACLKNPTTCKVKEKRLLSLSEILPQSALKEKKKESMCMCTGVFCPSYLMWWRHGLVPR